MFKAAVFDLDGTLVDTLGDLSFAMNEMLEHFGYPKRSKKETVNFIGNGQRMFTMRSLPEYARSEANIDVCTEYYASIYSENLIKYSLPYPGIPEALNDMKKSGMKLAVLSNKSDIHVQKIISTLFGDGFFDIALGAGHFAIKPDPAAVLYIADNLGLAPSEIAFVGDSDVDIKTALNAGMCAVGVSWGYRNKDILLTSGAHKIADNSKELSEILLA